MDRFGRQADRARRARPGCRLSLRLLFGGVYVRLLDSSGQTVGTGLLLDAGNGEASKAVRIETAGVYHISISGYQERTVSLTDPPVDEEPGLERIGGGVQSTGLFWLDEGTVRLFLSLDGLGYATLFDEQGNTLGSVVKENANPGLEYYEEIAIPAGGRYLVNVEVPSTSGAWTLSLVPVGDDQKKATVPAITTVPTAAPTTAPTTTVSRFGARRHLVGNVPSSPPVGIAVRAPEAVPTRTRGQFGTGSTAYSPPQGKFQRWYPATRWRTGR